MGMRWCDHRPQAVSICLPADLWAKGVEHFAKTTRGSRPNIYVSNLLVQNIAREVKEEFSKLCNEDFHSFWEAPVGQPATSGSVFL